MKKTSSPLPNFENRIRPSADTLPLLPDRKQASNSPKQAPSDGVLLVGKIPEQLSGRAMTDDGDNDTSVAGCAGAGSGVPGTGESPMRAA